jgi:hypothetical protein
VAVDVARERRETAAIVRYQIRDEVRAAEAKRERYEQKVTKCAIAVLAQHAAETGLSQKVAELQRRAADEGARLLWLAGRNVKQDWTLVNRVREALAWRNLSDAKGAQAYETALQALRRDATAEIG